MSVRNIAINNGKFELENVDINGNCNIDGKLFVNGVQITGNSAGGTVDITNTDGTITVQTENGNYVLSNAGLNPDNDINMNNHNIRGLGAIYFNDGSGNPSINVYPNEGKLAYNDVSENTVNVFDDTNNYPFISTILTKNNSCGGNSLTSVNNINMTGNITATGNLTCNDITCNSINNSINNQYEMFYFNNYSIPNVTWNYNPPSTTTTFTLAVLNNNALSNAKYIKLFINKLSFTMQGDNGGFSSGANFNMYLASQANEIFNANFENYVSISTPNQASSTNTFSNLQPLIVYLDAGQTTIYINGTVTLPNFNGSLMFTNITMSGVMETYNNIVQF